MVGEPKGGVSNLDHNQGRLLRGGSEWTHDPRKGRMLNYFPSPGGSLPVTAVVLTGLFPGLMVIIHP